MNEQKDSPRALSNLSSFKGLGGLKRIGGKLIVRALFDHFAYQECFKTETYDSPLMKLNS